MIATIIKRRCQVAWIRGRSLYPAVQSRALCLALGFLVTAAIFGYLSWATFPERDPFGIDANPQFRESARYTLMGFGAFLCGMGLIAYDIYTRPRKRKK